jgi:CxxC-x17-CxxC domain-containing protein
MTDNNERKMYDGNWECSQCHGSITRLPFKPTPGREGGLVCRDCFKKRVGGGGLNGNASRQMFEGNWKCAGCGGAITSLPFQPDPSRENELKCRDCFRK